MKNMSLVKKCRVCGDFASGFNYDALSCNSCKVFFYRNLRHPKLSESLRCDFDNTCEINRFTRKKCSKCRLTKCYMIGMKLKPSETMQYENQKTSATTELALEISIIRNLFNHDIQTVSDYVTKQVDCQAKSSGRIRLELTSFERISLDQVRQAIRPFTYERTSRCTQVVDSISQLQHFPGVLHNQLYIKNTIQFCHHFAAFNSLSASDQLALLKPFVFGLTSIWFIFQFDCDRKGVTMFTDESQTETIFIANQVVAKFYGDVDFVHTLNHGSVEFHNAFENDVNIRDLTSALMLFKMHSTVSHQENIRYHYWLYCLLLRRYLQCKHRSVKNGDRRFRSLMHLLDQLQSHQDLHRKMLVREFQMQNIPAVIREIYNLV